MSEHQDRWDAALAVEHGHQEELLRTLRGELGAFAQECASALTALDAFVGGLSGIATIAAQAQQGYAHAKLLHDLARTRPGETTEGRSDRELLQRVASDASVRAELENLWGPAPVAVLQALEPLRRWIPTIASMRRGEQGVKDLVDRAGNDLVGILSATESAGAGGGEALAADAGSLAQSLRDTVAHVEHAARSIKEGKLEEVLAESRRVLEADLAALAGVIAGAAAAEDEWQRDRREEHGALTKEVHEKLDRVERVRGILGWIFPHLQAIARSLTTAEKALSLEHKLFPEHVAVAAASQQLLLIDLASLWHAGVPPTQAVPHRKARRPRNTQLAAGGVGVVALVAVGIALAVSGGSSKKPAAAGAASPSPTTTASGWTCSGNQFTLFNNTNGSGVSNGGTPAPFTTKGKAYCVTYVYTYHWNNGKGPTPGTLILTQTSGPAGLQKTISIPAKGSAGTNNAQNVNWYADVPQSPPTVIDGSYTCADSSPSTWSSNAQTGGNGFCTIYAVPAQHA